MPGDDGFCFSAWAFRPAGVFSHEGFSVASTKLMSRVSNWFKSVSQSGRRSRPRSNGVPAHALASSASAGSVPTSMAFESGAGVNSASTEHAFRESARSRRPDTGGSLDDRLTLALEGIRAQLAEQSSRTERMASAIERLAGRMESMPDHAQAQSTAMDELRIELAAGTSISKRIEHSVGSLPKMADTHREALVAMQRHVEDSTETSRRAIRTLGDVHATVISLENAATGASATLRAMQSEAAQRYTELSTLVRDKAGQVRSLLQIMTGLVGLGIIVGVASLVIG